ncbi:MAG: hypothetical protein JST07_11230 [Bacteroidetes bacterium]|nr:hypothetical protein [Bacteroidota bacterium]
MKTKTYIISPKTGREILVSGKAYKDLLESSTYKSKAIKAKRFQKEVTPSKAKGCTNANRNKYPDVNESDFCGSAGGSCARAYPVNTPSRARAALTYARHAPNPQGIRDCVYEKAGKKGWLKNGKIKVK